MLSRSKIQKLSTQTSDRLSAAQVIPDIPSIIKELIDNSVDAKANIIKVQLYDYGKRRIEVTDNGSGISLQNLKRISEQGATSKISQFQELQKVESLGFRGQALCSIANISKMQIESMHQDSRTGYLADFNTKTIKQVQIHSGTKIILDDLYYTLPARKSHMSAQTVSITNQVLELFKQYSLIYVSIQFILRNSHDGKNDIYFDSGFGKLFGQQTWKQRIGSVLGSKVSGGLVYMSSEIFEGWIMERVLSGSMKPEEWLKKKILYLYCNKRPINFLPSIANVLDQIYKEYNPSSKYICILNLKFKENQFDVNVSPDKRSIYWKNEQNAIKVFKEQLQKITEKSRNQVKSLHTFVERKSFRKSNINQEQKEADIFKSRPSVKIQQRLARAMGSSKSIPSNMSQNKSSDKQAPSFDKKFDKQNQQANRQNKQSRIYKIQKSPQLSSNIESANICKKDFSQMKIIGQFNCGFIICQLDNRFFLVDQHSADQKSNYQKILISKPTSFVTHATVPLTPDQHDILTLSDKMKDFGYKYQAYCEQEKYYVNITQMPVYFGEAFKQDFFIQTLESQIESFAKHPVFQKKAATYACRKSIMIGDTLRKNEMEKVVHNLSSLESPWNCPHGRPTSILLNSISHFIDNVKVEDKYDL